MTLSVVVESEESFFTLRGVTEVFFQLTALTSDRVELGESETIQPHVQLDGRHRLGFTHKEPKYCCSFCITDSTSFAFGHSCTGTWTMPSTTKIIHLLSISEQHVPPTVVVRPLYALKNSGAVSPARKLLRCNCTL